jgi:RNA polymerase sigma-70 factor (ECF subfamily)
MVLEDTGTERAIAMIADPSGLRDAARPADESRAAVSLENLFVHRETVFRICLGFSRNYAEAEDLAQDVYLKAHRHLPRLKNPDTAREWLFRIARNTCLDHQKTSRLRRLLLFQWMARRPETRLAAVAGASGEAAPHSPDPRLADLKAAVRSLPPKLREAFVLREYAHLSYEDIAAALGLKTGTVMSRLHRARAAVARKLQEIRHEQR